MEKAYICARKRFLMKLLFAILLMTSVLCSEFANILEFCNVDVAHLDISFEGEGEKETKENVEDFSKLKIRQGIDHICAYTLGDGGDEMANWPISTPYLEIHSPPPEFH